LPSCKLGRYIADVLGAFDNHQMSSASVVVVIAFMTSELESKVFLVARRINSHVSINYVDEDSLGALHDRESESGLNESSDRFSSTMLRKDHEL